MQTTHIDHIRPVDQSVLDLLRQSSGLTVQELTDKLDVTPTAVRQRLERLVEAELIERRKESASRGRPQYRYALTALGMRYASVSYADLASALWQEVMDLPNRQQRTNILRRVAKRMATSLKSGVPQAASLEDRLTAIVEELGKRKVPAAVRQSGLLPVLEVYACPYPGLTDDDESRRLCELEQDMLSEAIGQSVQLDCCRLDGHSHCNFRPLGELPELMATSTDKT